MSDSQSGADSSSQFRETESNPVPTADVGEKDANTVDWEGPQDVANPQNWPLRSKWAQIILVSLFALVT